MSVPGCKKQAKSLIPLTTKRVANAPVTVENNAGFVYVLNSFGCNCLVFVRHVACHVSQKSTIGAHNFEQSLILNLSNLTQ